MVTLVLGATGFGAFELSRRLMVQAEIGLNRPTSTGPAPVNPDSPQKTEAAVSALLAARSKAIKGRDEVGFLRVVDRTNPAFISRQRELFASLRALPLASATWDVRPSSEYNRPALATKYGAPVFVSDVKFTYQLLGYDTATVASAQTLTFVRRDGQWLLGGDRDLDNLLPRGGHSEPWDLGPIEVTTGAHSLVIGTPRDAALLPDLAKAADEAVDAVAGRLDKGWSHKVVLYAPRDEQVIATYFRSAGQSVDRAAAVQIEVYDQVPDWLDPTEVSGSRVIFNPNYARPGDPDLAVLLRHEFTHVATRSITVRATPSWLVEGYAEYIAYVAAPEDRGVARVVAADAAKGEMLPYLPGSTDFYSVENNYDRSWLLCLYVGEKYDPERLHALYVELSTGHDDQDPGDAARAAISKVLRVSQEQLLKDVNKWAKKRVPELGSRP